ncbi:MAG: PQQ-binding-like beta-propeller repeat protein [Acidobacteria bacterium]|nr:PQQ-binding-like beta-propeller repeat protein [Acidobacteriota bacterium]
MKKSIVPLLLVFLTVPGFTGNKVTKVWETAPVLTTVESVNYDARRNVLYASCINGSPAAKDGNGFISKLKPDGTVLRLKWVSGLNAPKGAAVAGSRLFVSDIDVLVEINIETGKIIARYPAPGAQFLNDVVLGPDGTIYVSDSSAVSAVYRFNGKSLSLWFKDKRVPGPNGLAVSGNTLIVGSGRNGTIAAVSFKTGRMRVIARSKYGVDGLIPLGNRRFLTSDWKGHTGIAGPDSAYTLLLDTAGQHINAADLGYISGKKLFIVPTFFHNTAAAYRF